MIQIDTVSVGSKTFQFLKVEMENAPLLLLKGKIGYVMCGYLNIEAAEKLGDVGVRVTGVKDVETMLSASVSNVTTKASALGIKQGDLVSEILNRL